jgi:hypothetical protein
MFHTLEEAQNYVDNNAFEGVICPCCHKYVKVYKRSINATMVRALFVFYDKKGRWVNLENYLKTDKKLGSIIRGGEWCKLKCWDLIEKSEDVKEEGGRSSFFRITDKGCAFIEEMLDVPKYAFVFNNEVVGFDEDNTVSVQDCLKKKFDYDELMGR